MAQHPDWKLSVEGNTDNIGGAQYNPELSQRRAEAVKKALVREYRVAPQRLETTGFGASHPVDTNDTIEGRASQPARRARSALNETPSLRR